MQAWGLPPAGGGVNAQTRSGLQRAIAAATGWRSGSRRIGVPAPQCGPEVCGVRRLLTRITDGWPSRWKRISVHGGCMARQVRCMVSETGCRTRVRRGERSQMGPVSFERMRGQAARQNQMQRSPRQAPMIQHVRSQRWRRRRRGGALHAFCALCAPVRRYSITSVSEKRVLRHC